MRTHYCGELSAALVDQTVTLCGWAHRRRDHGGVIFIDLRDRSGTVQITVDPDLGAEAFAVAEHLRSETVLQVNGRVRARPAESINERLATGKIEVLASAITETSLRHVTHRMVITGSITWCDRCGAYAETRGRGMARPCRGPVAGGNRVGRPLKDVQARLRALRAVFCAS